MQSLSARAKAPHNKTQIPNKSQAPSSKQKTALGFGTCNFDIGPPAGELRFVICDLGFFGYLKLTIQGVSQAVTHVCMNL